MDKFLVLTVAAQVLLISIVMVIMGRRRFAAARNKEIHHSAFRTMDLAGANESVITASRNFDNQFQMPMLFIFAVLFTLHFGLADLVFVLLAALFVALRLLHTVVHITSNHVRMRFNLFLLSCVVLWCFWLRLVVKLW
ncbi:MAPEG family protein [Rheinheimera sp. 4Y26]|uniref:MAPEG family protein n=1 Tax=Rheinheimera sp. 4Y26 TaxID=2977811 RepID=UPI0021B14516|nr:MAPEG family protein [Rheinheimera sp. 4Y26]MCT6700647.1 MAPEG family protein [Rheinheimera sp. 4Y26]